MQMCKWATFFMIMLLRTKGKESQPHQKIMTKIVTKHPWGKGSPLTFQVMSNNFYYNSLLHTLFAKHKDVELIFSSIQKANFSLCV